MMFVGGLELLVNHKYLEGAPAELKELIDDVYISSSTAISVLNDLLHYESVDAGSFILERSRIFVSRWSLRDCTRALNQFSRSRGINFQFNIDYDASVPLEGHKQSTTRNLSSLILDIDSSRIEQVIRNLVTNAVKFTKRGGKIAVRLTPLPLSHKTSHWTCIEPTVPVNENAVAKLHVEVVDTGVGIGPDNQAKLFSQFLQVNRNELQGGGGSGLGLWICRHIIELHGGTIGFFSEGADTGSTFFFDLPLFPPNHDEEVNAVAMTDSFALKATIPTPPSLKRSISDYREISILIVDDSQTNRKLLARMLSSVFDSVGQSYRLAEAEDGVEAVEAVRQAERPFDCILLDSIMVQMHGPEAASIMRSELIFTNPIISVTGNALQEDIDHLLRSGVDRVLTKPVSRQQLIDTLCQYKVLEMAGAFEFIHPL